MLYTSHAGTRLLSDLVYHRVGNLGLTRLPVTQWVLESQHSTKASAVDKQGGNRNKASQLLQ